MGANIFTENHGPISKAGYRDATAGLNTAIIWKRSEGTLPTILRGHIFPLELVAFSPDGHFAVTASRDESVRLWDVASGRELLKWPTRMRWVNSHCFSEDRRMVLATGEGRSFAWDISRLTWDATRAVLFPCGRLLNSFQWSFTQDERQNDPLVRDVWLPIAKTSHSPYVLYHSRLT
jgi:WD40 repeat protein